MSETKLIPQNTKQISFNFDIEESVDQLVKNGVESFVKNAGDKYLINLLSGYVKSEVKKLRPIHIKIDSTKPKIIDDIVHQSFESVLFHCKTEGRCYLCGPAGSGKSTIAGHVAKAMDLPFYSLSCTSGMSEAHITGRMLFDKSFVTTDFLKAYEDGGVFLFDEIDAADNNTLMVLNSGIANGYLPVPNRSDNPVATKHKDFILIAAGNTWGNGSNIYHGRNHQDAAFLDRFAVQKVLVEYDKNLEGFILDEFKDVAEKLWSVRKKIAELGIRRILSTRVFYSALVQLQSGKTYDDIIKTYTTGWTKEEISKVF